MKLISLIIKQLRQLLLHFENKSQYYLFYTRIVPILVMSEDGSDSAEILRILARLKVHMELPSKPRASSLKRR